MVRKLIKTLCYKIMHFIANVTTCLIHEVALARRQEGIFRSSSQAATCPSVYHTRWKLYIVSFIAELKQGSCEYQLL